jgi:hypothetical protein
LESKLIFFVTRGVSHYGLGPFALEKYLKKAKEDGK